MAETSSTVTVQEVMQELGIGQNSAYELIRQAGFPSIPCGNKYIIPREAFYAWLRDPDKLIRFKASLAGSAV